MQRNSWAIIVSGAIGMSAACARPAAASLVAYWDFSQTSGQTVPDATGNGFNGTLGPDGNPSAQAPTLVSAPAGGTAALNFDGSQNQYVNISGGGGLNALTTGTIGMWVDWTSNNQQPGASASIYGAVLGRQSAGAFSSDLIGLDGADPSSSHIVFWGASSDPTRLTSNASPGVNQWHYLTVTFTPTSQQLYLDGSLDASLNNGLGAVGNDATVPLAIGAWIGDGNSYSNSMIANVSVWDEALSPTAVQSLANGAPGGSAFPVPEPATASIVGIAVLGLLRRRRRQPAAASA